MTPAAWALQKALFTVLSSDTRLTDLLGGPRIFDDAPQSQPLPYVTFGQSSWRDWSTGTDEGEEHVLTLQVWAEGLNRRKALEVLAALRAILHQAALTLDGNRLVNMRHEFSECQRDTSGELTRGLVRFRAVTEPLP
jgi:Protein of unknown function (DUF3168)